MTIVMCFLHAIGPLTGTRGQKNYDDDNDNDDQDGNDDNKNYDYDDGDDVLDQQIFFFAGF